MSKQSLSIPSLRPDIHSKVDFRQFALSEVCVQFMIKGATHFNFSLSVFCVLGFYKVTTPCVMGQSKIQQRCRCNDIGSDVRSEKILLTYSSQKVPKPLIKFTLSDCYTGLKGICFTPECVTLTVRFQFSSTILFPEHSTL